MIRAFYVIFATTFLIIALACCKQTSTPERPKTEKRRAPLQLIRFSEPQNGSSFSLGQFVDIELKLINDTIAPDSIILFVDNQPISKLNELNHTLETGHLSLGSKQIRATAWHKGERQTASIGIRLKADRPPKTMKYKVVKTFPHDITAYTQGLFYHNGYLVESTGQKGASSLRRVELETGKVLQSVNLDRRYFGEGATYYDGEIYQITWTSRKGFVYEPETFKLIRTFDYLTQGWGLTTKDDTLIMSDGSNKLYFLEPKSFSELKRLEVFDDKGPVNQLNELEYINGKIYANVYQTDRIVIINPYTGMVEFEVDFSGLLNESDMHRTIDVFNGIAWDDENKRIFVTGKNWPKLFQVEIY